MTVAELEELLFGMFPREWAEPWDRVGLMVGDPTDTVSRVAVALDPHPSLIQDLDTFGVNVLLTHHPICLEMPTRLLPAHCLPGFASSAIWEAIRHGVSVLSFHTNLDRSPQGASVLCRKLGFEPHIGLEIGRAPSEGNLGCLAYCDTGISLSDLVSSCKQTFGAVAQVFSACLSREMPEALIRRIGFMSGSMSSMTEEVLSAGCEAVICGECGYHAALDLSSRAVSVIILGHDISEYPMVDVVSDALRSLGFSFLKNAIPDPHICFMQP